MDRYVLFLDKPSDFECKLSLEGASLRDALARIVLEANDVQLLFPGKIQSNGKCSIPIGKLKRWLSEGQQGNMKLEIIAEDAYFQPWSTEFVVDVSKKMRVEVLNSSIPKKAKLMVEVETPQKKEYKKIVVELVNHCRSKGIVTEGILSKKRSFTPILNKHLSNAKYDHRPSSIIKDVLLMLRK